MAQNEMRAMRGLPQSVRLSEWLGFFELFEGLSMFVFPCGKSIRAATMNDSSGSAWTRELDIFGEHKDAILLDEREHSYWEVDVPRLRADLRGAAGH